MIRSAAYRIAIVSSIAYALATIALGLIVYLAAHATSVHQVNDRLTSEAAQLVSVFDAQGRSGLIEAIHQRQTEDPTNQLAYALFAPDGRRLNGNRIVAIPPPGLHNIFFRDPHRKPDLARALTLKLHDGAFLAVAADTDPTERIDSTIVTLFGVAFAGVLLIGALGAFVLGRYLRQRLSVMNRTAEAIMAGNLDQRIAIGAHDDEFDRLAGVLNRMLDRITGLLENLRQVSGDVAHDLRTPLARLRHGLENGLNHGHVPDERDAALEHAIRQSDDVLALFAALLRISEVEAGNLRQAFAPVDLSKLVRDTAESYAPAIEDGIRHFLCDVEDGIVIPGDRELLAQALVNLLDNAQIHTPLGTTIRLDLARHAGGVSLSVSDNGFGVPSQDMARLTRRFTRLDASRTRPGHGLGLALVDAIARMHHATLLLTDNAPGLCVTIDFAPAP